METMACPLHELRSIRREPDHVNDQIRLTPDAAADIL
jgi:hypothetical protein